MDIKRRNEAGVITYSLKGRLDTNTAPELEAVITKDLNNAKQINLELKDLDYISSAGLRVVLMTHKQMTNKGGSLNVLHPKEEVMDVFDMTGFSSFLNIEE